MTDDKRLQVKLETFKTFIARGIIAASEEILKISGKSYKAVKESNVGLLAENIDNTLNTFVNSPPDPQFLRYQSMTQRIFDLIIRFKTEPTESNFWKTVEVKKLEKLGLAYGYMCGVAVMSSMTNVFISQARENLIKNKEINNDAKIICLNYVNDVFSIIMMTLSKNLDSKFKIQKSERRFFASVLTNSDWTDAAQAEAVQFKKDQEAKEASENPVENTSEAA